MLTDEIFLKRCIELAQFGLGNTYPNPLVGSVVVYQNQIIGEGWHQKAGQAHAEVRAIQSVKNPELLPESTVYVSLEPCAHYGKTPPCADLLIEKKVKRVVIGCRDSFDQVDGKGIQKLKNAGIEVSIGILEQEARKLNRRFFTYHEKKRPYIILKWAQSQDGFLAPDPKEHQGPFWMTSPASKQRVHQWRTQEQAILIGGETLRKDNPQLNVRLWEGNAPIRFIWSQQESADDKWKVCDESAPTHFMQAKSVEELVEQLFIQGIQSIIIEGGAQVLQQFISAEMWDEARLFTAPVQLVSGTKAPELEGICVHHEQIGPDHLQYYEPRHV